MRPGFSRRDLLLGSLGLLAVGCTGSADKRPLPTALERRVRPGPPRPSDLAPLTAEAGPELVLMTNYGAGAAGTSIVTTVYADGRVLRVRNMGMFGESEPDKPALVLARAGPARIAVLQALVDRQEFLYSSSAYHEPNVHDGGSTSFYGGSVRRRILVINDPPDLPSTLRELGVEVTHLQEWLDRIGVDAFTVQDGIVLEQSRRFTSGHGDTLIVYADGMLDYRINRGDLAITPDGDDPYPIVTTRRVDGAHVQPLVAALQTLRATEMPPHPRDLPERYRGTVHFLKSRELSASWDIQQPPPPPLERVLLETAWLRAIFDAPPDEASKS